MESSKAGYIYFLISNCNTLCLVTPWAVRPVRKLLCVRNIGFSRELMDFISELSMSVSRAVLSLLPVFQRV